MAAGDVVQAKSANGSGTAPSVTLDAAPTDGNLLVVHVACGNNTEYTFAGYTQLTPIAGGSGGNTRQSTLNYKIASSDGATITGSGPNSGWAMSVVEIEGPVASPLLAEDAVNTTTTPTHTSPSVTPASGRRAIAVGAAFVRDSAVTWSNQTIGGVAATERTDESAAAANANSTVFTRVVESTSGSYAASADTSSIVAKGGANIAIFEIQAAGGQSVSLTPAVEADAAQSLTAVKSVTLPVATETDTAQALTARGPQRADLTPATETGTAQALTAAKYVTLPVATETDAAQTLSVTQGGGGTGQVVFESDSEANIGSTRATSLTIPAPAGIADGDLLLAVVTCNNNTVAVTAPDGTWTEVSGSPFHDAETGAVFYKFASGESGDYAFGVGGTTRSICGWIGRYSGVDATTPIDVAAVHTTGGIVPSMTTDADGCMLVAIGWYSGGSGATATFTPPTGFTEEVDQHTTVGTATESSMTVADMLQASAGATGTLTIGATSGPSACAGLALKAAAVAGGSGHDLTPATESDAAQVLTALKQAALASATETDGAQTLAVAKHAALTPAVETGVAQALTAEKQATLPPAAETGAAHALTAAKLVTLPVATESGTAQPLTAVKEATLPVAAETDTAVDLAASQAGSVSLVPAVETDVAEPLTAVKYVTLPVASESDGAQALAVVRQYTLPVAVETSTAQNLTVTKALTVTPASETGTAQPFTFHRAVTLSPAVETSTAVALTVSRQYALPVSSETDDAQALTVTTGLRSRAAPGSGRTGYPASSTATRATAGSGHTTPDDNPTTRASAGLGR